MLHCPNSFPNDWYIKINERDLNRIILQLKNVNKYIEYKNVIPYPRSKKGVVRVCITEPFKLDYCFILLDNSLDDLPDDLLQYCVKFTQDMCDHYEVSTIDDDHYDSVTIFSLNSPNTICVSMEGCSDLKYMKYLSSLPKLNELIILKDNDSKVEIYTDCGSQLFYFPKTTDNTNNINSKKTNSQDKLPQRSIFALDDRIDDFQDEDVMVCNKSIETNESDQDEELDEERIGTSYIDRIIKEFEILYKQIVTIIMKKDVDINILEHPLLNQFFDSYPYSNIISNDGLDSTLRSYIIGKRFLHMYNSGKH